MITYVLRLIYVEVFRVLPPRILFICRFTDHASRSQNLFEYWGSCRICIPCSFTLLIRNRYSSLSCINFRYHGYARDLVKLVPIYCSVCIYFDTWSYARIINSMIFILKQMLEIGTKEHSVIYGGYFAEVFPQLGL